MTAHAISWAPYLPWSVIGLLGLVAFALCIWAFYRQAGGTALRGLTFAILLLILANPSLVIEERDPISDIVVVISDRSQSQSIKDRPEQTDQATAHILAELEALENTATHLIEVKTGSLQEEADGTRLFTALRGRLRSLPRDRIAGVIVISDGQVHDVPADFQELGIEAPFHLLLTGDEEERDRRLLVSDAPNFAIIGKPVTVTFTVEDQSPEGERGAFATVMLRQDGRLLEQRQVPFDVPQEFEVTLTRRGNSLIEIEVEAGPNELSIVNNRAAVIMNGVRDRLRVLLVSGEPFRLDAS